MTGYIIYVRGLALSGAPFRFSTTALAYAITYVCPCGVRFNEIEIRQERVAGAL